MVVRSSKQSINFNRLRCFHGVAMEGGFTQASKALGISQPSITTHVKALETDYGVELFSRHGHHVELTELGRTLLSVTQRVFSLEGEAIDLLREASGLRTGHLRIGAIGPSQVTKIALAFGTKYPDVELSVSLGNSRDVLDRVMDFQDDVAILPRAESHARLHAVPFSRNRVVILVRKDHPWAARDEISLKELQGERLVLREVGSATRRTFEQALTKAGVSIKPVLAIGSREAVCQAVINGLGMGIALEDETLPQERLTALHFADSDIELRPHVACLQERKDSPLIRAFFDLAAELAATD